MALCQKEAKVSRPDLEKTAGKEVSVNSCRLCAPLGAALAYKGLAGCVAILHGSQGCSTYIRRYLISHFREPIDLASSNFTEEAAVFGGRAQFHKALDNLAAQYQPQLIGTATTCLAETIGEDIGALAREYAESRPDSAPILAAATPAYKGSHRDGYRAACKAIFSGLCKPAKEGQARDGLVMVPAILSCQDLRWLKARLEEFFPAKGILAPDWSDSLEGGPWDSYRPIPSGGTPRAELEGCASAQACLQLGLGDEGDAAAWLEAERGLKAIRLHLPMGIGLCDEFLEVLAAESGRPIPQEQLAQRDRLADAMADAHKYAMGKRVLVFGDEDFCPAAARFLSETGLRPVLVACGGKSSGRLAKALDRLIEPGQRPSIEVIEGADFEDIEDAARRAEPDLLLGNSKGYKVARSLGLPLVRVGFPVHDRFGGQRIRTLGYDGSLELFERILNALIEAEQAASDQGYWYY